MSTISRSRNGWTGVMSSQRYQMSRWSTASTRPFLMRRTGVRTTANEGNARSGYPWPSLPDARLTASVIPWLRPTRDSPHSQSSSHRPSIEVGRACVLRLSRPCGRPAAILASGLLATPLIRSPLAPALAKKLGARASCGSGGFGDAGYADCGGHVVDAQEVGAFEDGEGCGGEAGGDACLRRAIVTGELAEETLARGAHQHRTAERHEFCEPGEQFQRAFDRLAEADPGVERHALARDPTRLGAREAFAEEARDIVRDIGVRRVALHVLGRATHVHEHQPGA